MDIKNVSVVLASASPRRKELLSQAGCTFEVIPAEGEEKIHDKSPDATVLMLSKQKAMEVAAKCDSNTLVIGADTVVAAEGKILGKPKDYEDAFRMLSKLRNSCHSVYTGVTIIYGDKVKSFAEETRVYVRNITDEQLLDYIHLGECMDKAGAYGIQGRFGAYVEKIEGDYFNVVGLPICRLMREIEEM